MSTAWSSSSTFPLPRLNSVRADGRARPPSPRGAALVLVGAGVAAFLVLGGSSEQSGVAGDSAALARPRRRPRPKRDGGRGHPLDVVSDASAAWTLDGDAQTISRVSPDGGRALTKAPGFTPTALALGGGELWASYVERGDTRRALGRGGARSLDAALPPPPALLPGTGPPFWTTLRSSTPTALSGSAVPTDDIRKLDPVSHRVLGTAAGSGRRRALWLRSRLDLGDERSRCAAHRSRHAESHTANPPGHAGVGPIAVGASSVWVGDPLTGTVWRIQPGPPLQTHTIACRSSPPAASRSATELSGWRARSTARSFESMRRPRTYAASS